MRGSIRLFIISSVVLAVAFGGITGTVAAEDEEACTSGCIEDPSTDSPGVSVPDSGDTVTRDGHKVAATRVRKAFLTAKKAFHEGRQPIQAIKKGNEEAREDVPTFFESEE